MTLAYSVKACRFCPWALMTPLGLPVVPDVNNRSDRSRGPTASARSRAATPLTIAPRARKPDQSRSPACCGCVVPNSAICCRLAGRRGASWAW
ncbi:hypothetical protein D3C80_1695740 [compost metagenome]